MIFLVDPNLQQNLQQNPLHSQQQKQHHHLYSQQQHGGTTHLPNAQSVIVPFSSQGSQPTVQDHCNQKKTRNCPTQQTQNTTRAHPRTFPHSTPSRKHILDDFLPKSLLAIIPTAPVPTQR
ncbi:hypothetical protein CROQUDRAFT_87946 [Cronartium quercuum f. sp. fusiforme G11]|uniref:Uncharacterized protein n=1 Tax=Cronartium quercuum f. sp. fusiforme G11 TaxID=708437 RepID=A0A9P6TFY3_9BASI|nr:hypothetical protein CROQUDRAFT_87946 [Cronartium quercuum f. sp. fusiforme G11]